MRNKRGFTLIELLAVIVILAIIALIAAPIVLNMINSAKKNAAKSSALYYMEAVEKTIALREINDKPVKSGVYEINGDLLTRKTEDAVSEEEIIKVLVIGELPTEGEININDNQKILEATFYISDYKAIYDGHEIISLEKSSSSSITPTHSIGSTIEKDSIHQLLEETILKNGNYTLKLTDETQIPFEIYTFNKDIEYNKNEQLCDDIKDNKMCILKYKGNLTINNNIILTPQVRKKGFVVYVDGTLTNNGTISMTARGAKAEGQNVALYKNNDNTYETVPALGGLGGAKSSLGSTAAYVNGKIGVAGTLRSTGGGGSGAVCNYSSLSNTHVSGSGGTGTSYSGGTGGGGVHTGHYSATAENGAANGGAGGNGAATTYKGNDAAIWTATGGAGNDGGLGYYGYNTKVNQDPTYNGNSGTGGLLIIYSNYIINNGLIDANGVDSYKQNAAAVPGGSLGGGSVNIFYKENYTNSGTVQANGGASVNGDRSGRWFGSGGAGGNGTITIGSIKTGTFVKN